MPASVSGFITGMYVICTPLLAAPLLKQRIGRLDGGGAARVLRSRWSSPSSGLSVGYGEALTFVAAVLYALHIVGLGAGDNPRLGTPSA